MSREEVLNYHRDLKPGKLEVVPSKVCLTQADLAKAYTPGVAIPCLEIKENPETAYDYTGKGNLVGVISDGSAVLGLGNIGALAGKPVMEGKALLFKRFAGIDAFDIEINESDTDKFVEIVKSLEPTFGGINLEDISSPRCFEIEEKLKKSMNIPVFHDDQHGTAVICAAGVLNGLEISGKKPENCKVVITGAGAAGVAIAKHLINCGVKQENVYAYDKDGVLFEGRKDNLSEYHKFLYRNTNFRTLEELFDGADVYVGVSVKGLVSEEMVKKMAPDPVIFPMANPDPEITYEAVKIARPDAIVGTGRTDFPNQVNNLLGFPAIFRGALDARASRITEKMKMAATQALIKVTKMPVLPEVLKVYGLDSLEYGRNYIIPKPFDPRVLVEVAFAVAKTAVEEGVNRVELDLDRYKTGLEEKVRSQLR